MWNLAEHVGLLRGTAQQAAVPERLVAGGVLVDVIAGTGRQAQLAAERHRARL